MAEWLHNSSLGCNGVTPTVHNSFPYDCCSRVTMPVATGPGSLRNAQSRTFYCAELPPKGLRPEVGLRPQLHKLSFCTTFRSPKMYSNHLNCNTTSEKKIHCYTARHTAWDSVFVCNRYLLYRHQYFHPVTVYH